MTLILGLLFSLISLLIPSSEIINNTTAVFSNTILADETINEEYQNLYFNEIEHYLGLNDAISFAINNDNLYYSTDTAIFSYNLKTKKLIQISNLTSVKDLKYINNSLYAFKGTSLYNVSENENKEIITNCDIYSMFNLDNVTYISYISSKIFHLAKLQNNELTEVFNLQLIANQTPISLTSSSTNAYLTVNQNDVIKILNINYSSKNIESINNYESASSNLIYFTTKTDVSQDTQETTSSPIFFDYNENMLCVIKDNNYIDFITHNLKSKGENGLEEDRYYKIQDYYVFNNKLYVLDKIYYGIQVYNFENGDLKFEKVLISSSQFTAGKFYNPQSFEIVNDLVLVADTYNRSIQIIKDNKSTLVNKYLNGKIETQFGNPLKVLESNNKYYVLQKTELSEYEILILKIIDNKFVLEEKVSHGLNNIDDIEIVNNVLYVLDNATNKLYNTVENTLKAISTNISDFKITPNAKMDFIKESNTLAVLNKTEINLLNLNTNINSKIILDSPLKQISHDYYNNIYLLNDNKILKYSLENLSLVKEISLNDNYLTFNINKENGLIWLFNIKNQNFVTYKNIDFVPSIKDNFVQPVDVLNLSQTSLVKIAKTNNGSEIYEYPFENGNKTISNNEIIYILDSNKYTNYHYVAFNSTNENKSRILKTGYILKSNITNINIEELPLEEELVVLSKTKLYTLPTVLKYNNQNLFAGELNVGDRVKTKYVNLKSLTNSIDNSSFYIIKKDNKFYYLKEVDVVNSKVNTNEPILKTNARVNMGETNQNDVIVYISGNMASSYRLKVGTRIFVKEINKNEKYTFITFLDENNREKTGYILTNCIKMDYEKESNVSAIILIVVTILAIAGITTFYIISYKKQQVVIKENKTKTSNNIVLKKAKLNNNMKFTKDKKSNDDKKNS